MPTLNDDWIAPPGPPWSYLKVADQLMHGIRVLATHGDRDAQAMPLSMLCAHALECALKAILSENGTRIEGHDISKLWKAAAKDGWSNPMPAWAKELSDLHAPPYHLRHLAKLHVIVTPTAQPMVEELEKMIEAVDKKLRGIAQ